MTENCQSHSRLLPKWSRLVYSHNLLYFLPYYPELVHIKETHLHLNFKNKNMQNLWFFHKLQKKEKDTGRNRKKTLNFNFLS